MSRFSLRTFLLLIIFGCFEVQETKGWVTQEDSNSARVWMDTTGKFTIEAEFVEIKDQSVVLRKKDGSTINVPLSKLSDNDRRHAQRLQQESEIEITVGNLRSIESRLLSARLVHAKYSELLSSDKLTEKARVYCNARLVELKTFSENNLILVGGEYISMAEINIRRRKSESLMDEFHQMASTALSPQSLEKLEEACDADQVYFHGNIVHGLLYLVADQDYENAERHFSTCIRRGEKYLPIYGNLDRANFAAVLNNLAVIKVRGNKLNEAYLLWQQATELVPELPLEMQHNIVRAFRFIEVSQTDRNRSFVRAGKRTSSNYEAWAKQVGGTLQGSPFSGDAGWIYLPYIRPDKKSSGAGNVARASVKLGDATAFAIHSNYLITHRNAVEELDRKFDKVVLVRNQTKIPCEVVAVSEELNLALLKCQTSLSPVFNFSVGSPTSATEAHIVQYTDPVDSQRPFVALAKLAISPQKNKSSLRVNSIVRNIDLGAPVVDNAGNVIAVLNPVFMRNTYEQQEVLGVSSVDVLKFVSANIPNYNNQPNQNTVANAIESLPNPSTFQIQSSIERLSPQTLEYLSGKNENTGTTGTHCLIDYACIVCDGRSIVGCPNQKCRRGDIEIVTPKTVPHPSGKGTMTIGIRSYKSCPTCRGRATVDCWGCPNGRQGF